MLKKILLITLAIFLTLGCITPAFAGGGTDADIMPEGWAAATSAEAEGLPVAATVGPGKLPCKSAILIDQQTGRVLYEENADEQLAPASITKIMTMLLTVEALEDGKITLDEMVTTSPHANSMGGTQIWLEIGEQMSVHDLLRAVATVSANDAAVALGEHLGGSEEAFAQMMNRRAKQLGMTGTNFVNASGLDAAGHLTTARDIAIMSRELMAHPLTQDYTTIWMDELRGGETQLVNTNKLIRFYSGATGLKTGSTDAAGQCLAATAQRNGLGLVAVVLGSKSSDDRFASARGLLDYGFANFEAAEPPDVSGELTPVKILGGEQGSVTPQVVQPDAIVILRGSKNSMEQEIVLVDDVAAPVEEGQYLGKVVVKAGGEVVGEYPLICPRRVEELTFFRALKKLFFTLVQMN